MARRALVIGAGIGGITAAIALRRAGLEVEVLERAAALTEVGAGIGLWANALRALDRIDLGAPVRQLGVVLRAAVVRTWRGDTLMRIDNTELERRFGDVTLVVHRAELLDTCWRRSGRMRCVWGAPASASSSSPIA
jgi:2-polyprenyl-6-methoxyphenol hydroxylase-like FAD-dependent oxidoreductase